MGFFAHVQTMDTRPLFPPPMWPGYETTANSASHYCALPLPYTSHFPEKMINYYIPSIQTPTFEIIVPISEHLHLAELERGSPNIYYSLGGARPRVTERLLHTTGVLERLLDYCCHCEARTGVAKRVLI